MSAPPPQASLARARRSRRGSLWLLALLFLAASVDRALAAEAGSPLVLATVGDERGLPERLLGGSAEAFFEHLIDNPVKTGLLASMHLAFTRFPGGTQSNYYDWKRGLIFVTAYSNSSAYTSYWAGLAPQIASLFPAGISLEQYKVFSDTLGAEIVMVPNLETASVADQVAWFQRLAAAGVVPSHIELGNEFYIAMEGDPNVEARWPDEPTTMALSKQYLDGFRTYLPPAARVAVQAAPGPFGMGRNDRGAFWDRMRQWNVDLHPESWFDAVTIHLYPRLEEVTGDPNANYEPVTTQLALRNFAALMARHDDGTDETLADIEGRVPGKEIWITEWNPRGGQIWVAGQTDPVTPALALHLVTRMVLACLRHLSVTMNLYFMLNFLTSTPYGAFVPDGSSFAPLPATVAFGWLCEAANGGATFQRVVEAGGARIPGGGSKSESYAAIEGAIFRAAGQVTLIVQNAGSVARSYDLTSDTSGIAPSLIETLSMPDLADTARRAAQVARVSPSLAVTLAPYSVTRVVWQAPGRVPRKHLHPTGR